jgi:hypothetical protein
VITQEDFYQFYLILGEKDEEDEEDEEEMDPEWSCLTQPEPGPQEERALPPRPVRPMAASFVDLASLDDVMYSAEFDGMALDVVGASDCASEEHSYEVEDACKDMAASTSTIDHGAEASRAESTRAASAQAGPGLFTPVNAAPLSAGYWTSAIRGRSTPVRELSPRVLHRHGVVTPTGAPPVEGSLLDSGIEHVDALRPLFLSARTLHPTQFPRIIACAPLRK